MAVSNLHMRDAERGRSLSDYWPLISLVVVSALAAFAIAAGSGQVTMRVSCTPIWACSLSSSPY
jgi:hypothetical protein